MIAPGAFAVAWTYPTNVILLAILAVLVLLLVTIWTLAWHRHRRFSRRRDRVEIKNVFVGPRRPALPNIASAGIGTRGGDL